MKFLFTLLILCCYQAGSTNIGEALFTAMLLIIVLLLKKIGMAWEQFAATLQQKENISNHH